MFYFKDEIRFEFYSICHTWAPHETHSGLHIPTVSAKLCVLPVRRNFCLSHSPMCLDWQLNIHVLQFHLKKNHFEVRYHWAQMMAMSPQAQMYWEPHLRTAVQSLSQASSCCQHFTSLSCHAKCDSLRQTLRAFLVNAWSTPGLTPGLHESK